MLRNMNKLIPIITIAFLVFGCSMPVEQPPAGTPAEPCPVVEPPVQQGPGVNLPTEIQISPDFSAEQLAGILEAIHDWSDRTYGVAKLNPVIGTNPDAPCQLNPVDHFEPEEVHRGGLASGSGIHCSIQLATSVIKLIDARKTWNQDTEMLEKSDNDVTGVTRIFALKQFGAIFGIPQLETGLMSENYDKSDDLDDPALAAFCGLHECPNGFKAGAQ